ncbi:MAG: hypothetical protein IIX27_06640 [Ruminococcus sp.]|nr:hypothetical protein [Ruminococcus sp.]
MKTKTKASVWQHLSFAMLVWYLASTFILNLFFFVKEDKFNSFFEMVYEICCVFRICLTDFVFLSRVSNDQTQITRIIVVVATLLICLLLIFLATLIYKKCTKTVIKGFLVLVFVDFVATIIFMINPIWLALALKAVLIIFLFLAMATVRTD